MMILCFYKIYETDEPKETFQIGYLNLVELTSSIVDWTMNETQSIVKRISDEAKVPTKIIEMLTVKAEDDKVFSESR